VKSEPSNESDADIPPGDRHGIKGHSDIASEVDRNQEEIQEKLSISHHSSRNDLESGNGDQVVGNRKQALTGQDTE
jgi:hypothetical protein